MTLPLEKPTVQVDVVSDVVCPWCIIGFLQLNQALDDLGIAAKLRWHPFELNPGMPPEGQNLREHIAEKYGASVEQSDATRAQLVGLGKSLGFDFVFGAQSKIVNTFQAHQLLDWAETQGAQHPLKLALFDVYFSQARDVSDRAVLVQAAASVGLDADQANAVLTAQTHADQVRAKQQVWTQRGITGVPAMVFDGKYLVTGAQGRDTYGDILKRVMAEAA
ncbi:MAG: DsbA family oxidoreductase [Sedimentitalea sp.]